MIVYRSRFLNRGEVWFDNNPTGARVDWIIYHQRSHPFPKANWRRFYTRIIDLTKTSEELMADMDGFTASDIRKAEKKDQTVCQQLEVGDPEILTKFADFYDRFALAKRLGPADRDWLALTAETGKLDLWTANSPDGKPLVYHIFYRDQLRVRSLHLASLQTEASSKEVQRRIGRANRLLMWHCMLKYRERSLKIFDLGGWYNGTTDLPLIGINKFKESFGGKIICEYQGEQLLTLKAWTAVMISALWQKLKQRGATAGPFDSRDAPVPTPLAMGN